MQNSVLVEPPVADVRTNDDLPEGVARVFELIGFRFHFLLIGNCESRLDVDLLLVTIGDEIDLLLDTDGLSILVFRVQNYHTDIHRITSDAELVVAWLTRCT